MKSARVLVFSVLSLVSLLACTSEYIPAEKIQFDTYSSLIKDLKKEMSYSKLSELNAYVDSEMKAAMHEVFANADDENTQVYYGSNGESFDGHDGMRVIWHRSVPAKNINITVMTFWRMSQGSPRLAFGSDGIRVRTFVGSGDEWKSSENYIWLSYEISGTGNEVKALQPTTILTENGRPRGSVASEADPAKCASCHTYHTMRDRVSVSKLEEAQSLLEFLELDSRAVVPAEYGDPKKVFFVKGL